MGSESHDSYFARDKNPILSQKVDFCLFFVCIISDYEHFKNFEGVLTLRRHSDVIQRLVVHSLSFNGKRRPIAILHWYQT